jgi:nitric oxide dioxygenase
MSLNAELIQDTFSKVALKRDDFADTFYTTLFDRYPAVIPLFEKTDLPEQKKKLVTALAMVVKNIKTPDVITEKLKQLGSKHVGYGAEVAHFDAVGECILHALQTTLGNGWNDEVAEAWSDAYAAVADLMKQGM